MAIKNTVIVGTVGYSVFRSDDGGDHWQKLWKEFSEVRTLIWVPS